MRSNPPAFLPAMHEFSAHRQADRERANRTDLVLLSPMRLDLRRLRSILVGWGSNGITRLLFLFFTAPKLSNSEARRLVAHPAQQQAKPWDEH